MERRRRTGAADHTRKVGHEHQQRETAIGISRGCTRASLGALEPSAETVPDSWVGSLRPLPSPSSSPPVLLRTAPSRHPSLAPLRVATRDDEDSASRPVGGGGAGRRLGAALGAEGPDRWLHSTHSAPLRTDGVGAPLSTSAVPAGPQQSSFVSTPCGGAGGCSRGGSGGAGGAHSRSPCGCLRRLAARSPRVLWRPMEHFRCAIPRRPPPLPPHSGRAECDDKVARPPRPPLPFQSDTPRATSTTCHKHTRSHRRNTCTIHLNTSQHARGCIADGAQSSFGTAPLWLRRDKTLSFGPETAPNIHFSRRLQGQGGKL